MTTTADKVRLILGLSSDVVSDDTLATAVELAEEDCAIRANRYNIEAPTIAVVYMSLFFLRTHLDLAGIKPSSLTLPDLAMSTDFIGAANQLIEAADKQIKGAAFKQGRAFTHLRAGRVQKWH